MKKIVALAFIILGGFAQAQTLGNSPYSIFGLGDIKYDNNVETASMGGIGTAYISDFNNSFNFKNPAANTNFELTSLRVQGNNENSFFSSNYNNLSTKKHSTYLSNLSLAFPISKDVKFGIGYQPYSSSFYELTKSTQVSDGISKYNRYSGTGTISTLHAALAYKATSELNLGLRANYIFGSISDLDEISFTNAELVNGRETSSTLKALNFTLGSTYQKTLKNDKKLTLGATYTFASSGSMGTDYSNSTYFYAGSLKETLGKTILETKHSEDKSLVPQEFSLGLGYGHEGKWFASTQVDYKKGASTTFLDKPFVYEDSYRVSAGGWYLPNYNNFRNYFSRVIYRYGAFYEKGNLKLNNTNINQYGITLGATLPFEKTNVNRMSGIDLGIELGQRGTTDNNLVSQTFVNFKIGINFASKWFEKYYFD